MPGEPTVPIDRADSEPREGGTARTQPVRVDDASADSAAVDVAERRTDAPATVSATTHPADIEEAGLSDEEIAMYRRRVDAGVYNTHEVADEVVRRMMKRGDI